MFLLMEDTYASEEMVQKHGDLEYIGTEATGLSLANMTTLSNAAQAFLSTAVLLPEVAVRDLTEEQEIRETFFNCWDFSELCEDF